MHTNGLKCTFYVRINCVVPSKVLHVYKIFVRAARFGHPMFFNEYAGPSVISLP